MLKVLGRIIQEFQASQDIGEGLTILVNHINDALDAQLCGIFLTDVSRARYTLYALAGGDSKYVGKASVKLGEGLVGFVGERESPLNLDDATQHEMFRNYLDVKRKGLRGFLAVPIIHNRIVLGVICVMRSEAERFDGASEAFLITLAIQFAGIIADAQSSGSFVKNIEKIKRVTLTGVSGSPGVSVGVGVMVYPLAELDAVPERSIEDIKAEIAEFRAAVKAAKHQINELLERMQASLNPEELSLFEAYLQMLEGKSLVNKVIYKIKQGQWAQGALKNVINQHISQFEAMDDPYLRERAADVKDLGQRILAHLQSKELQQQDYPAETILVGEEITPSSLVEVPEGILKGVVSVKGSANSHVAILARAMGVPTVMGMEGLPANQLNQQTLIIDGYNGNIYLNPTKAVRDEFERLIAEEQALDAELEALRDLPAETEDGHRIGMYVNTGLLADMGPALSVGAEGVGLYRTEVPFMMHDRFPTEEEQTMIYRQMLKSFAPMLVNIRTLDVGGDKTLPYFPIDEANPFLGWRGIRITLDHPEIFSVQLRSLLRASSGFENLHIMFPMVSSVQELEAALVMLQQIYDECISEDDNISMPKVGVMIEVPSAVYQAQQFARRVDFLSVGSNDLVQYMLAVDRNNSRVASLYDALHPSVLSALQQVVKSVHREKKQVSLCGEMAGDPVALVLLLAMGFDSVSMNAMRLPRMKWVIRKFTLERAKQLLKEVMEFDDALEIRNHMEMALEEAGLGSLIRAGR